MRKLRRAELSFLHVTLRTDLFYNPTKYLSNISYGCRVMLMKPQWRKKHGSGDIIRPGRQAELSFLYATLSIDLLYNPTKYHSNISNSCSILLRNQLLTPDQPTACPPAHQSPDVHPLENLVKKQIKEQK